VRSDAAGTTLQFTRWMSIRQPALWNDYCARAGLPAGPCGPRNPYPVAAGSGIAAQAGALGVAGFVSDPSFNGAITYVEYSYALNAGLGVVKVLNRGGFYVPPTASNVSVALLHGGDDDGDPRAYPLAGYSQMIVPTALGSSFTLNKGATLSAFARYALCEGQQYATVLGYAPLPVNVVQTGLDQLRQVPGADPT